MAELKTKPTTKNAYDFLNNIENNKRKKDSFIVLELMKEITKEEPVIWGDSIIGFGSYEYESCKGTSKGSWPKIGFSPRKQKLVIYIMQGFEPFRSILEDLGKYKLGKSCLYINKLEDIDMDLLKSLISNSFNSFTK